jgi:hypothetical protein
MHARRTINTWLSRINPDDPALVLDTHGQCQLVRTPEELCTVFVPAESSESVVLYSHVWHLTHDLSPAQYEALLALNLMGIKTFECTLGLDQHLRALVLSYSLTLAGCELEGFCTAVDNFFSAAAKVRAGVAAIVQLQTPRKPAVGSGAAPLTGSHLQQMRFDERHRK